MMRLKTRMTLRRNGAVLRSINRGTEHIKRSGLRSEGAARRHCSIFLAASRREGAFHPHGSARLWGGI